jgi:hypothetical protein
MRSKPDAIAPAGWSIAVAAGIVDGQHQLHPEILADHRARHAALARSSGDPSPGREMLG